MSNLSYGSITITDLTDIGQLSAYPTGNMPNTIIYNQDQNTYTPTWTSNNSLVLTPIIFYAGTSLTGNNAAVTVQWYKQVGIGSETEITTNAANGETIDNDKKLIISQNPFSANSTTISYILKVTYHESSINRDLTAEGRITYSLLKQVSSARTCDIIGDSVFTYNENRAIKGATSITLTAIYKGQITLSEWQYLNSSGVWTRHPNTNNADLTSITISYNDNCFNGDKLTLKLTTSDPTVYDIHNIIKLYDGSPGDKAVVGTLTNEDQMIPCDSSGTPISYTGAESCLVISEAGQDVTDSWDITLQHSSVSYQKSTNGTTWVAYDTAGAHYKYVKITGITADTGSITFTASKTGYDNIVKTFSLIKITQGADAPTPIFYRIYCPTKAVNKAATTNDFNPSSVTIKTQRKVGNGEYEDFALPFTVKTGNTNINTSTGTGANAPYSYIITTSDFSTATANGIITIQAFLPGNGTNGTPVDTQTITITTDGTNGSTGPQGPSGKGAINLQLLNPAAIIPCDSSNKTLGSNISIGFRAWQGTELIESIVDTTAFTAIATASPTCSKQGNSTNSYVGEILYTIPSNKTLASNGEVSFRFTVTDKDNTAHVLTASFYWARSSNGTNGTNGKDAAFLQLYTTSGTDTFVNDTLSNIVIQADLIAGGSNVNSSVTSWTWKKYKTLANGYVVIDKNGNEWDGTTDVATRQPTSSITINKDQVDSYASYQCIATYSNNSYINYFSVFDKSDPIQVTVLCSFGDQITNGQGVGALYVIVTRLGEEIDPIKTKVFSETDPTGAANAYYYKLDKTYKTISLMKFNGSTWVDVTSTEQYTGNYEWSFRDKDGNVLTTNVPASNATANGNLHNQKVIYIDGTFINKKIIADVAVTI